MFSTRRVLTAICLVLSLASVALASCVGTTNIDVPFTLSYTRTGDGSSTSFYVLVCSTGCEGNSECPFLETISVGVDGVDGANGNDDCGPVFPVDLSAANVGCETVRFTVPGSNTALEQVCPGGCQAKLTLRNGQTVVKAIEGSFTQPNPSPEEVSTPQEVASPEPEVSMSPELVMSPEVVPNPSPSETVLPTSTPQPYGRRRVSQLDALSRRLSQYGANRRLNQYGKRKLRQYGSK